MKNQVNKQELVKIDAKGFLSLLMEAKGQWFHTESRIHVYEEIFFDQSWNGTRIFLKDLCFEGEVDFGFSKPTQLIIENCSFQGGLKLSNAEIEHLELSVRCDLKQGQIEL